MDERRAAHHSMNPAAFAEQDRVVIAFHAPPRAVTKFAVMSVAIVFGGVALVIFVPGIETIALAALAFGSLAGVWLLNLSNWRVTHGGPLDIVATRDGLTSPLWSVPWACVDGITQVVDEDGRLIELWVQSSRVGGVQWRTRTLRWNARLNRRFGYPPVRIPQAFVDRPLIEILVDLARIGRLPLSQDLRVDYPDSA